MLRNPTPIMAEPTNDDVNLPHGDLDDGVVVLNDQATPKRQRKLTSKVWLDFDRVPRENKAVDAICKHCKTKMDGRSTSGTTHLKNHLKNCRKRKKPDIRQQLLSVKEENDGSTTVETFKFDQERSRLDLARMLIIHELPFAFVDYDGFRLFVSNLQPLFRVNCAKTIASYCMEVYKGEKLKMYDKLENVGSRISITSDLWTSCQNLGYMSLTAHYIDKDWKLHKMILNFVKVDAPHTADRLSEAIMACLMEWNIDGKLFAMALDNCTTNDRMSATICAELDDRDLLLGNGKLFHIRCAAHILNLIVQDGLNALGDVLMKVRDSVEFVTKSQKKQKLFDEVVKQVQIICGKSLILDCPTRWNSTYDMIEVALMYKNAFTRLHDRDRDYKLAPTKAEWDMAYDVAACLKKFNDSTKAFSGSLYPTANIFFLHVCEIHIALMEWVYSPKEYIRTMANVMKFKFDKYWSTCHSALAVAAILDPQFKLKLVAYFFPKIYRDGSADKVKKVEEAFESLYNEYATQVPLDSSQNMATNVGSNIINMGSGFDQFVQETSTPQGTKRDIDLYLEEPVLPRSPTFDILSWWKVNEAKYPILSAMARDILGIPVSTVPSESAFSTGGRVITKHRSSLYPETVQMLICTQSWLKEGRKDQDTLLCGFGSESSCVGELTKCPLE